MSNGEDGADDADESADDVPAETGSEAITEESLTDRLDEIESALESAETETALDEITADLESVATDLEAADLPEPDDEDDDEPGPAAVIEDRLDDLRSEFDAARGPYASDVVDVVEAAISTIEDTRWTADGADEVATAVETVSDVVGDELDVDVHPKSTDEEALVSSLESIATEIRDASLDADADAEQIATLLEAAETLEADLEDAEEWDDLETNEKLLAQGFYDVLGHYKDYPVEWSALKEHERRGNADMVLLALESLQSDFMEQHCLESLARMGKRAKTEDTLETLLGRAEKRDQPAIKILGKMNATEATETLVEYVDNDSNPQLQKFVFRALGEIGDDEAVQPIANKLVMDDDNVRPYAARALGLIGNTSAIDPLAETLESDENDNVRGAAAWALRQIGTRDALEIVADYTDERAFTVQTEAEKAAAALETAAAEA